MTTPAWTTHQRTARTGAPPPLEAGAAPLSDAAGAEGELSGWIDHSPPSRDFRPGQVSQIGRLAQLDSAVERYVSEHDFSGAHPGWLG